MTQTAATQSKVIHNKTIKVDKDKLPAKLLAKVEKLESTGVSVAVYYTETACAGGQSYSNEGQISGCTVILAAFATENGAGNNPNRGDANFYTEGVNYQNDGSWRIIWHHDYNTPLPAYFTIVYA